jgi:hypothetical protein
VTTIHNKIRKLFEVKDKATNEIRRFEAVGFLCEGEPSVDGNTMLSRTSGENGGAIGEEDEKFIWKHCYLLPTEFWPHDLVTNRRDPEYPHHVLFFDCSCGKWYRSRESLDEQWGENALVVRRLA